MFCKLARSGTLAKKIPCSPCKVKLLRSAGKLHCTDTTTSTLAAQSKRMGGRTRRRTRSSCSDRLSVGVCASVTVCLSAHVCVRASARERRGEERRTEDRTGGLDGRVALAVISCDLSVIAYLFVKGVPLPPFNSLCCARGSRTSSQSHFRRRRRPRRLSDSEHRDKRVETPTRCPLRDVGNCNLQHIWCFVVLQRPTFHSLLPHLVASSRPGVWRCSS